MSRMTTAAEAEQAIAETMNLIECLHDVVERETTLVRAGQVRMASALASEKAQLSGSLHASHERLKPNRKFMQQSAPSACTALANLQEAFRVALQRNMVVLATAHAVSERIVRRLSTDLARKTSPQVYGASGRTAAPNPRHGQPLALSRVL